METQRVLQVATWMNTGGLETFIMNLYRNIDRDRLQFDFLVFRDQEGFYDQEIKRMGGRIFRMPSLGASTAAEVFKALDMFFSISNYRVVHSHIDTLSTLPLYFARKNSVPVRIAHSHNTSMDLNLKAPVRVLSRAFLPSQANIFLACSKKAAIWLYGGGKVRGKKVQVIPNAIDAKKMMFRERTRDFVRNAFLWDDKFVVGHVGRFSPQKNHMFLMDIFYDLLKIRKDAHLVLVGDGELKGQIVERIASLGISDKVSLLGVRDDIADLLSAFDVFLLPSLYEGLPLSIIEAQTSGLPCFTTQGRVTTEADITGLVRFILLEAGSETWARNIATVDVDSEKRSVHFDIIVKSGYDIRKLAQQMERFYLHYTAL